VIIMLLCTEREQMEECDDTVFVSECEKKEGCNDSLFLY